MAADHRKVTSPERELLDVARGGSDDAFARLVEPYRRELHAHCYRMLGSVHDAEDALQDTLVRAWRGLHQFEGRSSLRSWLYRIATNACLDRISQRAKRALPIDYGPPAEPGVGPGNPVIESTLVEPYPDQRYDLQDGYASPEARYERRESVELAFIVAVQQLPATQRAVLILRDVLGFSAREVADTLATTVASANGALRRARKAVGQRLPAESQQANLRALGDRGLRELVERYIDAWERGDVDAILMMLADDATFAMPPLSTWYRGRDAITAFLTGFALRDRWRLVPTSANGQLAFGAYAWEPEKSSYTPLSLDVLTLHGTRATDITSFVPPESRGADRERFAVEVFDRFGLPGQLR
jgi:RNA polymerase sigma-70 factor (ECF subfamily)